jgi:hypothetical protein
LDDALGPIGKHSLAFAIMPSIDLEIKVGFISVLSGACVFTGTGFF